MENKDKSPQERIALGECVSERGVDRCPYCIDSCDAHHFKIALDDELDKNKIKKPE